MAAKKRKSGADLKTQLFDRFYEFSFYRAVHLLERLSAGRSGLGQTLAPADEPVHFTVKPDFSFPPSDISMLGDNGPDAPATMQVAFMGLTGPSGVLPQWYTQLIMDRRKEKDHTLAAFLDIFNHRLITLFYLAWKKHRFPENYAFGAADRLSRYLLSFCGLGTPGLTRMIGLPEESLTFYSGLFSRPVASAVAIEAAVAYFSDCRVRVEQHVERIVELDSQDQTQLGSANASLGDDAICGSQVWESQTKFRVHVGPVDREKFVRLMPIGDLLVPIFSLVRYMVGIEFEFEIRIYLKKEEVPLCQLGASGGDAPMLGWTTWISSPGYAYTEDIFFTFQEYDLQLIKF
ncbi:type VI secretion system baseplate subunit TssG [Desulfosarcina ovata]|uniref:Type VI secretion system protein n=1 Tax=Desulfosarcina ovata subsp. ovata TaxID=2752305 RepID=A0A5K8A9Q7_9BACT|nr:type VI secretion system baseplate subunit TssG [Desulfosarcina ovata]BBO88770.1 type VI secretion system protein [Desulfosarcina ovata subsp. ovata]